MPGRSIKVTQVESTLFTSFTLFGIWKGGQPWKAWIWAMGLNDTKETANASLYQNVMSFSFTRPEKGTSKYLRQQQDRCTRKMYKRWHNCQLGPSKETFLTVKQFFSPSHSKWQSETREENVKNFSNKREHFLSPFSRVLFSCGSPKISQREREAERVICEWNWASGYL